MIRSTSIYLLIGLLSAQPALPQDPSESAQVPPLREFQLPPRVGVFTQMDLSLQEALAMALSNNRNVDISRIGQEISGYTLNGTFGVYDPNFTTTASYQKNVTPIASALGGSATGAVTNRNSLLDPGFGGLTPWGGTYQADLSSQRSSTNNTFTQLNPTYPSSLNFSYTQPLWRNLFYDANRRAIEVAKKSQSLSDVEFRLQVMQTVALAEQAYWNLAFAYNNLSIQLEAVQLGSEQDASNRRQESEGLLAPIDVVAAQRQLAGFELNAFSAQETLTRAENTLKTLILGDRGDALWSTALIPITPVNLSAPIVPLQDAINDALRNRPELETVRINGEINDANRRFSEEQVKPQVNLVFSHTNAGLAGAQLPASPNPFTSGSAAQVERLNELSALVGLNPLPPVNTGGGTLPNFLVGGLGQSLNNVFSGNFPTTQIGVQISLPLRNRTAEANLRTSIAETRRIQSLEAQAELGIEAEVRNAMQSVESARARLDAAQVARESAEQQYESEQRQFRAGTSTLFLVQQRQTDMVTARNQENRSQADLSIAIAGFQLATGRILDTRNIDIR